MTKKIPFTKMHGAGNDYIYIDCTEKEWIPESEIIPFAVKFSHRYFGIGSDGVIFIRSSDRADFFMDMYNADGSRGKMCGNGVRCVAAFVFNKGLTKETQVNIDTLSGVKKITLTIQDGKAIGATVNMGKPELLPEKIPVRWNADRMINEPVIVNEQSYNITAVSMGNPHAVVYVEKDLDKLNLSEIGPTFEKNELFPERVNTEFIEIQDRKNLHMRVWERGSGETMACGTGACAAVVASILNDFSERKVTMHLKGGDLEIEWDEKSGNVIMEGPAEIVFEGEVEW